MRARAIETGHDYWLRIRIAPVRRVTSVPNGGRGFPGWTVRKRARVIALTTQPGSPAVATVEAPRWVCVNAHWFPHDLARAMVDGKLRYRRQPHRWTVPVRDILTRAAPAEPTTATVDRGVRHEGRAS